MGAFELQIFVSLVVVLGAAFAALICDFLKGNNEQLRETNVELRVRQDERERQLAERERLQQQLLGQAQRLAARPVEAAPAAPVAAQAAAVARNPEADETRALFARASSGNRRRGVQHQEVAQWANELLEKKQHQETARLAELKARIEAREQQPARPAPVAPPAPAVEEKLPPGAGRVPLPALAYALPGPWLTRIMDAAALLAQPGTLVPRLDFTLVEPTLASANRQFRLSVFGQDSARHTLASPGSALAYGSEVIPPSLALKAEATLPEVEVAGQPAEPALVSDAVRIRVIDEAALAPETVENEIVVDLEPVQVEPTPAMAALQPESRPAAIAGLPLMPAASVTELAPELALTLPVYGAGVLPLESATPSLEEEPVEFRANVVELPVAVHVEPELALPNGLRPAGVLAHLLEAPEYYSGLTLSVGVVEFAKLVSEHGKPAVEQVLIALERTLLSVVRDQDLVCRVSDDEWVMLCPRELAGAAKRRTTLLSERLWDFQLRSLGGVSIFFSWGAGEGQNQRLSSLVAQAHDEMQQSRHMRRGAVNLAPRTRRRAVNA